MGEGESVQLLMRFEHQRGRYMMHCHNLTHEDHDMMQQFCVEWRSGIRIATTRSRRRRARSTTCPTM